MNSSNKYPFLKVLIPFVLGIWCYTFLTAFRISNLTMIAVMAALFLMAVVTSTALKSFRFNWLFGSIMACYLFFGGYTLTRMQEASMQKDWFCNYESNAKYYVARVYDYPAERENSFKVPLQLEWQFGDSLSSRAISGLVMAYFQKTDSTFAIRYGDLITINAPIGKVQSPKNPGEFDYRSHLLRKGITGQVYLKETDWIDLQTNRTNPLYAFSFHFRDKLLASLQRCGVKDKEFGVAAAILLGYDDSLADDVRKNYVAAGSMHILCVSGLHVGIIYLLASFLLGFLNRKQWQKTLKNSILLLLIWFYALIAGLSPSILRSAMMISFVIIGEMIRNKGFIINSIAASAFVLLCANPYFLFEIGFLLSYTAVIGIVVLQRPIYNLIYLKNKLLDKAWNITAVALSAQVATMPFTLFYFNQFTTYFWLSNLLMTPISFIVVMGGMLLLLVSWIPYVNALFGYLVWGAIYVMNWIVSWIESLPLSIIKNLYISPLEFSLLLVGFVLLLLAVSMQKRQLLMGMLCTIMLFMVSVTIRLYSADNQHGVIFFSLRKHTAVDFYTGTNHILLADSTLMDDEATVDYSLRGFWSKRSLSAHPQSVSLDEDFDGPFLRKRHNLVSFNGKLLALWNDADATKDSLSYRLPIDYLLVSERQKPDLQSVVNVYKPQLLLIDGSVPNYLAERWTAQAEEHGIPCLNIADGAAEF